MLFIGAGLIALGVGGKYIYDKREERKKKEATEEYAEERESIKDETFKSEASQLEGLVDEVCNEAIKLLNKDGLEKRVADLLDKDIFRKSFEKLIETAIRNEGKKLRVSFEINHNNVIIVGKTGVGKSTLINEMLHLEGDAAAETGIGKPVTQEPKEYTSDDLTIYDTRGIESGESRSTSALKEDVKEIVDSRALENDPDRCIHVIWYCIKVPGNKFEKEEEEALKDFMKMYDGGKLPVVIVLTQAYAKKDTEEMETRIRKIVGKETKIVPVVAKEMIDEPVNIPSYGTDKLREITAECAKTAIIPAIRHSVKKQVEEAILSKFNKEFCERVKSEAKSAIEDVMKEVRKHAGIESKLPFIRDILGRIVRSWFGGDDTLECSSDLDGVMEIITIWATKAYDSVKANLSFKPDELERKYTEAKEKVEKEHNTKIDGVSPSDAAAADTKRIEDKLKEEAEVLMFLMVSEYAVDAFVNALSEAFTEKIEKKLSSDFSLLLIDKIIEERRAMNDKKITPHEETTPDA